MLKKLRLPAVHSAPRSLAPAALILLGVGLAGLAVACKADQPGAPTGAGQTAAVATAKSVSGDPYLLTISVDSQSGQIGAIQFEVVPEGEKGGFAADSGKVECDSLIGEALSAFSTHPDGKLVGALVDVGGFATPAAVARCTYLSPKDLSADAFTLRVTDASDVEAVALAPTPSLVISEVKRVE